MVYLEITVLLSWSWSFEHTVYFIVVVGMMRYTVVTKDQINNMDMPFSMTHWVLIQLLLAVCQRIRIPNNSTKQ